MAAADFVDSGQDRGRNIYVMSALLDGESGRAVEQPKGRIFISKP